MSRGFVLLALACVATAVYCASAAADWTSGIQVVPPTGAGAPDVTVNGLSCWTAGDCGGTGYFYDSSTGERPKVVVFNEHDGNAQAATGVALPPDSDSNDSPDTLTSVSCGGAGSCVATGQYFSSTPSTAAVTTAMIEEEREGTWQQAVHAPLPPDGTAETPSEIADVSCSSAGNCAAVGDYDVTPTDIRGLLLTEQNGSWSAQEPTLPSGGSDARITSVACPADGQCSAVGTYFDANSQAQGLLLTEVDGVWQPPSQLVLPADTANPDTALQLNSVSCGSPGNCSAVGGFTANSGDRPLFVSELNGVWQPGTEGSLGTDVAGASGYALTQVSCSSAGSCSAIGEYEPANSNSRQGLDASESAGMWGPVHATPLPPGDDSQTDEWLTALSCPSAGRCEAVGRSFDDGNSQVGVILSDSNGSWTATLSPVPSDSNSIRFDALDALSCPTDGSCAAGGSYTIPDGPQPALLITDSGGTWSADAPLTLADYAPPAPGAIPSSVSCGAPGDCTAVGGIDWNFNGFLDVERNSLWTTPSVEVTPPSTAEAGSTGLQSVSCRAAGACSAVGGYGGGSGSLFMTETDGQWGTPVEAQPAGSDDSVSLDSVSCAAPGDCAAVGDLPAPYNSTGPAAASEVNGTWSRAVEPALPSDASGGNPQASLNTVSCGAPGDCGAIGFYTSKSTDDEQLLVNEVDGTWHGAIALPLPDGSSPPFDPTLSDISCPSAGTCAAVGSYRTADESPPIVVDESSGQWGQANEISMPPDAAQPTNQGGAQPGGSLVAVSCWDTGDCVAVGSYETDGGGTSPMVAIERNSTWGAAVEVTPPSGVSATAATMLVAVSCATDGTCEAVGNGTSSSSWQHVAAYLVSIDNGNVGSSALAQPSDDSASDVTLTGVSCATGESCTAIGTETVYPFETEGIYIESNPGGESGPATVTGAAPAPTNAGSAGGAGTPRNQALPTLSGAPVVGRTLTARVGAWSGAGALSYGIGWQRCAPTCANIPGARGARLVLTATDTGARIRAVVAARNALGDTQAASLSLGPILPQSAAISALLVRLRRLTSRSVHSPAASGGLRTTIVTPGPGTVTIQCSILVHGRAVLLVNLRRWIGFSDRIVVDLRPTTSGRLLLAHNRRLRVRLLASFAPVGAHVPSRLSTILIR